MQIMRIFYLTFGLLLLLLPLGSVAAQSSSDNFTVQRTVVGSGGSADSSSFTTTAVVGQPATTAASSSSFRLSGGFLFEGSPAPPTAVDLSATAAVSLAPFWLLVGAASVLLFVAALLYRRAR